MNNRSKGLAYVREVRKALEAEGYLVEGPGYRPQWMPSGMIACHADYFGVFDLLTVSKTEAIKGHQVCSLENKARNAKKIQDAGLSGYLWCRRKGGYDRYWVWPEGVEKI